MKATLVSWTHKPIETVLSVWDASKSEEPLQDIFDHYYEHPEEQGIPSGGIGAPEMALFERILDQQIPVAQFINFNFVLEDVPISWREQAVRHRIGVKYGDNYAVDIVPEADISFWSQSMRIQSMDDFASKGKYHTPDSIVKSKADTAGLHLTAKTALDIYVDAMERIEAAYSALVQMGIPMEDARNLIPLGATHRISMNVNLQALKHIIGERGCWILQGSLWAPVIESMVSELAKKVHPIFRRLVAPPCVSAGAFNSCKFVEENIRRVDGRDALPVCPLYVTERNVKLTTDQIVAMEKRIPEYATLWGQPRLGNTYAWETPK